MNLGLLSFARPFAEFPVVEWLVLAPPSVTAYTINVLRYLHRSQTDLRNHSKGYTFSRVVVEDVLAVTAAPFDQLLRQVRQRDPCALALTDLTPSPPLTDAPTGVQKPHNASGVPNGVIILWRPASRDATP